MKEVVAFRPDVVLFMAHVSDIAQTSRQLTKLIRDGAVVSPGCGRARRHALSRIDGARRPRRRLGGI